MSGVIASSPPVLLQHIGSQSVSSSVTLPFSQQAYPEPRQTTVSGKKLPVRSNAASSALPPSTICRAYTALKSKTKHFRSICTFFNLDRQTAYDLSTSSSNEKYLTSLRVDSGNITLNPGASISSLEEAETDSNSANASVADFGQRRDGSAETKGLSGFSYHKSITRGHWELITTFLNEEPDKERRRELREACTSLISTINSLRFILHNKYCIGEKLEADDVEVVQKVLLHHPDLEEKMGCGLDFIKIDRHPVHDCRCFFVIRKDGSSVDFSFRKCILQLGKQTVGLDITRKLLDFKS